jgi:hypothetical protein
LLCLNPLLFVLKKNVMNINVGKYEVIFNCVKSMGWKLAGSVSEEGKHCTNEELTSCNVHWVDVAYVHERLAKMAPWQHINHFPGMTNIARKAKLAANLEKMRREVTYLHIITLQNTHHFV